MFIFFGNKENEPKEIFPAEKNISINFARFTRNDKLVCYANSNISFLSVRLAALITKYFLRQGIFVKFFITITTFSIYFSFPKDQHIFFLKVLHIHIQIHNQTP